MEGGKEYTMRMICNNDVVSQNIGDTVRELAAMNAKHGAGSMEIHIYALQTIAKELLYCWNLLKERK